MAEQKSSSVLAAPLHGAASVLRRVPGAGTVGRAAQGTLNKVGAVSPKGRRIAVYTGAGVLGVAGVVEWPVALTGAAVAWLTQPRPERSEEPREPGRLTAGEAENGAGETGTAGDTGTGTSATASGTTDSAAAAPATEPPGAAGASASPGVAPRRARRTHATGEPAEDIATAALTSRPAGRGAGRTGPAGTPPSSPGPVPADDPAPKTAGDRERGTTPAGRQSTGRPPAGKAPAGKATAEKSATGPAATGPLGPTARPGRTTL